MNEKRSIYSNYNMTQFCIKIFINNLKFILIISKLVTIKFISNERQLSWSVGRKRPARLNIQLGPAENCKHDLQTKYQFH